jgi:di/tricarboxylate transporter
MGPEAWIVAAVVLLVLWLLVTNRVPADVAMVGAVTLLMAAPVPLEGGGWKLGVISAKEALAGLSGAGLVTVGALFIVVSGVRETGSIDFVARQLMGRPKGPRSALLRLMLPVIGASGFLNNTPLVAMMIPAVRDWCRKLSIAPSKLMLPLSYAAILGGTCTLIGTSTNLVVYDLARGAGVIQDLGLFEVGKVGLPAAILGAAFVWLFAPGLLPDRGSASSRLRDSRQYTAEMIVPQASPLAGKSIEAAGLRALPGAFIVEIHRGEDLIAAPGPDQVLRAGDRLVFTGVVESIKELQTVRGLEPATDQIFKLDEPRPNRCLIEAVVSNTSPLEGRTIKQARFRTQYQAVVIAVARNGERVAGKVGEIEMRHGDTLLLEAHPSFVDRHRDDPDFFLVSALEDSSPRRHHRMGTSILILGLMVAFGATGLAPMLHASLLAAGAMLLTRCTSVPAARAAVDWSVLLVIAAAFGLGTAIEKSGLARQLIEAFLGFAGGSPYAALVAIYLVTSLSTEVISNNAAVALVFPLAAEAWKSTDSNPLPFVFALMMAGSASFATPIGYQTNLMVMGPGGYRFVDYLRIGVPMNILMAVTTLLLLPLVWPL